MNELRQVLQLAEELQSILDRMTLELSPQLEICLPDLKKWLEKELRRREELALETTREKKGE